MVSIFSNFTRLIKGKKELDVYEEAWRRIASDTLEVPQLRYHADNSAVEDKRVTWEMLKDILVTDGLEEEELELSRYAEYINSKDKIQFLANYHSVFINRVRAIVNNFTNAIDETEGDEKIAIENKYAFQLILLCSTYRMVKLNQGTEVLKDPFANVVRDSKLQLSAIVQEIGFNYNFTEKT